MYYAAAHVIQNPFRKVFLKPPRPFHPSLPLFLSFLGATLEWTNAKGRMCICTPAARKILLKRPALFRVVMQRVEVISYRRFGTKNIGPILAVPESDSSTLTMGRIGCPETSVKNYHYSLRNNPEQRRSQTLRDARLESRKIIYARKLIRIHQIWRPGSRASWYILIIKTN